MANASSTSRPKRIAVTGGSGRIGGVLAKQLISRGHDVINIDRREPSEPVGRFASAHLAKRDELQPILEQVDVVCHLGEIPNANCGLSPEEVLSANVRIGSTVLQTAADLKLERVVYASSCQVYGLWDPPYGVKPERLPFDETHPISPHNCYALSKATNEAFARMVSRDCGLSVAMLRFPWVPMNEYSDAWEESARQRPTATDGFATYCHVTDVANAFVLAAESRRDGCETYHLSAAEILSLYPLAQRLREHHPDFPPLPADWPSFKSPILTQKATDHLGWRPAWNWLDFYRQRHGEISSAG